MNVAADWVTVAGTGLATRVDLTPLPLWRGVQLSPGIGASYPFSLGFQGAGPIRQMTGPQVIAKVLADYADENYVHLTPPPGTSVWANSLGDFKVKATLDHCGNMAVKSILEIGAGSSYVAERLMSHFGSTDYTIIDPAVRSVPTPIVLVSDYYPCDALHGRCFDLVVAFNCLEHVPDPVGFLRDVGAALVPGGRVLMTYPDTGAALAAGDLNIITHEHLSYFTEESSFWAAQAAGLEVETLTSASGAFTAVFRRPEVALPFPPPLSEDALLRRAGDAFARYFQTFDTEISKALNQGQWVGFHGATNGLNCFLALTGLGTHEKVRVYDGDDSKVGRYLSACIRPILPSTDPSYVENDLIYVSAMTFFPQISAFAVDYHNLDVARLRSMVP